MNSEHIPTTANLLGAATSVFLTKAAKNGTSSSSSSATPTSSSTTNTTTGAKAAEVEMSLNSISIIPTSNKLVLGSNMRVTSATAIHSTTTATSGAMHVKPIPSASLVIIDRTTLTPIPKITHVKPKSSTSIANTITITAKSANGSTGQIRTVANGSSILPKAVTAVAKQPKQVVIKSTTIPSGTTITKIAGNAVATTNKAKSTIGKPIAAWKQTPTLQTAVQNKDVFIVQGQSQAPQIITIFDPKSNTTTSNSGVLPFNTQSSIRASNSFTICEPKPTTPLQFSSAPVKAPPPHLFYLNQYMATAGKQLINQGTRPFMTTTAQPTQPRVTTNDHNQAIFSNSMFSHPINAAPQSVHMLAPTIAAQPPILTNELRQETTNETNMINVQISNGVLSDRQGPIRVLAGDSTPTTTSDPSSNITNFVSIIPINELMPSPAMSASAPSQHNDAARTPEHPPTQAQLRQNLLNKLQKSPRLQNRSRSLGVANSNGGQVQRKRRYKSRIPSEPMSSHLMSELGRAKPGMHVAPPEQNQNTSTPTTAAATLVAVSSGIDTGTPHQSRPSEPVPPIAAPPSSNVIDIEISNLSKICDSLFDSLECPENLDDQSSTTTSTTPEKPLLDRKGIKLDHEDLKFLANSKTLASKRIQRDPMKTIQWKQGLGYLPGSSLYYQTNEFLLIEPVSRSHVSSRIDVPFEQRINNVARAKILKSKKASSVVCSLAPTATQPTNPLAFPAVGTLPLVGAQSARPQQSLLRSLMSKNAVTPSNPTPSTSKEASQTFNSIPVRSIPFSWDVYLQCSNATAAPKDVFYNPFPSAPNPFEVGMKLECIDPINSSRFCVCSVVHVVGYRIRIHFDGHSPQFAFWCNADSQDIFPAGWCGKTGRSLMPPPFIAPGTQFDWRTYLTRTNSVAAPRTIFTHLNSSTTGNLFRRGMKLEADDLRNSRKICVATVADVLDNRIMVTFDGWDEQYDYWVEINSPFIHPVNWHRDNGFNITAPPDYNGTFDWETYLDEHKSDIAPRNAFAPRAPMGFKMGMKLELVDKKNPTLIRPSTVVGIDDYEIRVLFDGWPDDYAQWVADDHPDLHPINWCKLTGHPLEPTPSAPKHSRFQACGIPVCRGIGNANNSTASIHLLAIDCPYTMINWQKTPQLNRLTEYNQIVQNMHKKRPHDAIHGRSKSPVDPKAATIKRTKQQRTSAVVAQPTVVAQPAVVVAEPTVQRPVTPVVLMIEEAPTTIKMELVSEDSSDAVAPKREEPAVTALPQPPPSSPPQTMNADELAKRIAASDYLHRDYVPTLNGSYQLWRQNSRQLFRHVADGENSICTSNPLAWTVQDVARRVSELPGCAQLAARFEESEIDGQCLLMMSQEDLVETTLRLRRGQAIKVFNYIAMLREEVVVRWMIQ